MKNRESLKNVGKLQSANKAIVLVLSGACFGGILLLGGIPAVHAEDISPTPIWNYTNSSTETSQITQPVTTTKMPAKREFKKRVKPRRVPVFAPVPTSPQ